MEIRHMCARSSRSLVWIAATAWSLGLTALLCDHFRSPGLIVGARSSFGVFATGAIGLTLMRKARALADHPDALSVFMRRFSRWVYVLLYLLALARLGVFFDEKVASTGSLANQGAARSLDDFQFYIACCVVPLWSFRAIALTLPLGPPNVRS
jgi:hypothetical protein